MGILIYLLLWIVIGYAGFLLFYKKTLGQIDDDIWWFAFPCSFLGALWFVFWVIFKCLEGNKSYIKGGKTPGKYKK